MTQFSEGATPSLIRGGGDSNYDIVLLQPSNQENGDTDNEMGVENNLNELSMNQVVEVATSKPMSKVKTQEATKPDFQLKVAKTNNVMKSDMSKDGKVDKL